MLIEDSQLNKFILDSHLVSRADFEVAEKEAHEKKVKVADVLLTSGKITEDNLRRMQAHVAGIPFVDLRGRKIDLETLSHIPEPLSRAHNIVAYVSTDAILEVAMLDIKDLAAIDFIKKKTKLKIQARLTDVESMKESLLQYQKKLKAEFGDRIQKELKDMKRGGDEAALGRIVDTLLKHALLQNASDIHIEPQEAELVVRYRINGLLHDAMVLPKALAPLAALRLKTLAGIKVRIQNGGFKVDVNGEKISFRVSVLPTVHGEKIVMKPLRENVSGFTLDYLGFHGSGLEVLQNKLAEKEGMIIVAGPSGSGKTTTLYTLLDILNQPGVNISTIEDPVEYHMPRINQTQVNPEMGFTLASGLRTLMRQDPDVVMAGELRDAETANLAAHVALTGHLMLSSVSASSAAVGLSRMIEMKIDPTLLASTLKIVIGSRLVRRLSDSKEKYFLTKEEIAGLSKDVDLDRVLARLKAENITAEFLWEKIPFWKAVPGSQDDGFKGRVGIYEVLAVTPTIKDLISKGVKGAALEAQAKKEGMSNLLEDGIFKCVEGETTLDEVLRATAL